MSKCAPPEGEAGVPRYKKATYVSVAPKGLSLTMFVPEIEIELFFFARIT